MKTIGMSVVMAVAAVALGCGRAGLEDSDELANSAGDLAASFDEAAQGGGIALRDLTHEPEFMKPGAMERLFDLALPAAYADGCVVHPFSACSNGVRTREFSGCSLGRGTSDGTVTLTFSDANCSMAAVGASVTRSANFTVTRAGGGTFEVASPNGGQTVTRGQNGFTYEIGGIERTGVDSTGKTRFDIVVSTTQPVNVTGQSRSERVLDGGKIQVEHKLAGYTVEWVPDHVAWSNGCNCPTSGTLNGTVVGTQKDVSLAFTGCGTGTLTTEKRAETVTFDRCVAL